MYWIDLNAKGIIKQINFIAVHFLNRDNQLKLARRLYLEYAKNEEKNIKLIFDYSLHLNPIIATLLLRRCKKENPKLFILLVFKLGLISGLLQNRIKNVILSISVFEDGIENYGSSNYRD